jgi:hypothetical protein
VEKELHVSVDALMLPIDVYLFELNEMSIAGTNELERDLCDLTLVLRTS